MKHLLTTLALSPTFALAHGNHGETSNHAQHGWLHALMSFEGLLILAGLLTAVYFIVRKNP
jgi:hypothetical protein